MACNSPLQGSEILLANKVILITRPATAGERLGNLLMRGGAKVVYHPVITIADPESWDRVDEAIHRISEFEWIVFVSKNGVRQFLERCRRLEVNLKQANTGLAAIGNSTAGSIAEYGLQVDLIPPRSDSSALATALIEKTGRGEILIVRANRGSNVLGERLTASEKPFVEVVAYRSLDVQTPDDRVLKTLSEGGFDWVTITSSAIARSAIRLFGDSLSETKVVSISPTTSQQLRELGVEPMAEATSYDLEGICRAILEFEAG
jgi:uroporphyrinogen III methyltransferase/synthase